MANILVNIRRMKQEIGRAPDQRPVPVEILLHDQVMSCWRTASASISAKGMPVEMVVSFAPDGAIEGEPRIRSEEHTSELQSLMRISYAVFCLKKKTNQINQKSKGG